jgi:hypothetical protein
VPESPLPPPLEAVLGVGTDLALHLRTPLQHLVDSAAGPTGARYAALDTADPAQDGLGAIRRPGAGTPARRDQRAGPRGARRPGALHLCGVPG